jgi:cytochrome b pre-mRNA-processing protein 3
MLAAAVWRNLMGGKEDVDFQKLAQVVSYMRRELRALDQASDDEVAKGTWQFSSDPGVESVVVAKPAREQ